MARPRCRFASELSRSVGSLRGSFAKKTVKGREYWYFQFTDLGGRKWQLRDLLGDAQYERDGNELQSRGFYLDVPPWQFHVFAMTAA